MTIYNLSILCLLFLVGACASSTTVRFESIPTGADVYVKTLGEGAFRKVTQTPALVDSTDLEKEFDGSGPIEVEIRKEGFVTSKLLITELSAVDLKLSTELAAESGLEDQRNLNWVIDSLFEVKRLAQNQRYKKALKLLKDVKKKVPRVAAIYELEGGIYYLSNNYRAALDAYRSAVRYNPKNPENIRMRDSLEKNLGKVE